MLVILTSGTLHLGAAPKNGCVMAQDVSHQPLTVEAQVRAQVSPCGIYDGQNGTGTGFF
jgi:hypothetical protein